ncbi:MAG TPA: phospho-N-acetylmuramoyl-pentapeptide-transferase, partial [Phenylobacterium sp.]
MLYNFLFPLHEQISILNLFRYLTFRTGGAVLTALLFSFFFGPMIIRWLRTIQRQGQPIRSDGPASHLVTKKGTPTMGGILILLGLLIGTLLWADLANRYVWAVVAVTVGFGLIGFADDYLKVTRACSRGVPGKVKLLAQAVIAAVAAAWIASIAGEPLGHTLALPFVKGVLIDLGWFYLPFAIFVVAGASNAVNLTDGLDGLAIVPVMIVAASFALITYLVGNAVFSNYLQITSVPGAGELAVFCGATVGAGLGFLWYNAPPAMVFMGDTGSLSLGGALGSVSLVAKHELVLAIIGGLFVLETISVVVQVASFKATGRRVFR